MKKRNTPISAFTLVELSLALGVASFALVALFGLLPMALQASQASVQQTSAANITTALVADLQSMSSSAAVSPQSNIGVPAAGASVITSTIYLDENGGPFPAPTTATAASRYRATITATSPQSATRTATIATVVVSWPATAPLANASGSLRTVVALNRN